jgi:chromosome segregation ATPase
MNDNPLNFWSSGIWLIPLVLAATIAGLFLLARLLRQKALKALKDARGEIRRTSGRLKQVSAQAADHATAGAEPYRGRASALQEQLVRLDGQVAALNRQLVEIQEEMSQLSKRGGLELFGRAYFIYILRGRAESLRRAAFELNAPVTEAEKAAEALGAIAWEVAGEARRGRDQHIQARRILDGLSGHNVEGEALEAARSSLEPIEAALQEVPPLFLQGSMTQVQREADKADVVRVYAMLRQVMPGLEQTLAAAREWERQYRDALEAVNQLRQQLGSSEGLLLEPPPALDLSAQQKALDNLRVIARSLQATMGRLEVESLGTLAAEARRTLAAAQDLENQLRQARQDLASLQAALPALQKELQEVSLLITNLATSPIRPIAWGESKAHLVSLSRIVGSLEPARRPRSPEKLKQDLETAQQARLQLLELNARCKAAADQHAELELILSDPALAGWQGWMSKAQALADRASSYAVENWPRQDNVSSFASDLASLEAVLDEVMPGAGPGSSGAEGQRSSGSSIPVEEAELAQVVFAARQAQQAFNGQRVRAANIQARLVELQDSEKSARLDLEAALGLLQQAQHLIKSSDFLNTLASSDASKLHNEMTALHNELRQREHGSLEKKARAVQTAVIKAQASCGGWVDRLGAAIQEQTRTLSQTLSELEAVAPLDEPAVYQARELLGAGPSFSGRFPPPQGEGIFEALLAELKRRSDHWGRLSAGKRALDEIAQPVIENYQAAMQNRQFAGECLEEVKNRLRGWPPASTSLKDESAEFARLEEQWQALRRQRVRGISLASQVGGMAARYLALGEGLQKTAERAAEDQNQVAGREEEYQEYAQQWRGLAHTYANNPLASAEIQGLLAKAERDYASIKNGWKQQTLGYPQVLKAFDLLVRSLRLGLIAIDDDHSVDINGRVTRRR